MTTNMPVQSLHVEPVVEKDYMEQVCVVLKYKCGAIDLIILYLFPQHFAIFSVLFYTCAFDSTHLVKTEAYQVQIWQDV
jgi:hypothetical protein